MASYADEQLWRRLAQIETQIKTLLPDWKYRKHVHSDDPSSFEYEIRDHARAVAWIEALDTTEEQKELHAKFISDAPAIVLELLNLVKELKQK